MIRSIDVTTGIIVELPDEHGIQLTPTQLMKQELSVLAGNYKADMITCQQAWLTAAVADGDLEVTKKAAIVQDLVDLKAEYLTNVAAIKAKYA